jgi:hypothetical protein
VQPRSQPTVAAKRDNRPWAAGGLIRAHPHDRPLPSPHSFFKRDVKELKSTSIEMGVCMICCDDCKDKLLANPDDMKKNQQATAPFGSDTASGFTQARKWRWP